MKVENPWANANFADVIPKNIDIESLPVDEKRAKAVGIVRSALHDGRFLSLGIRQRQVLEARYLSLNVFPTRRQVGERFGIGSSRKVRRIEEAALKRLQKSTE